MAYDGLHLPSCTVLSQHWMGTVWIQIHSRCGALSRLLLARSTLQFGRFFKTLVIASVLVNALGAATFQRAHSKDLYGHFLAE